MCPDHELLDFFEYKHLPPHLQEASKPFCDLARRIWDDRKDRIAETVTALRKLLEAKDAAVRAQLPVK